jgi:hypothetical protein
VKAIVMRNWIMGYIRENGPVCATDQPFHEAFHERFGGARKETMWGAEPVTKAMRTLKKMSDDGTLKRGRVGLGGNWQPGFPRWNYVYYIDANPARFLHNNPTTINRKG